MMYKRTCLLIIKGILGAHKNTNKLSLNYFAKKDINEVVRLKYACIYIRRNINCIMFINHIVPDEGKSTKYIYNVFFILYSTGCIPLLFHFKSLRVSSVR